MSKANYWENTSIDLAMCDAPSGFTRTTSTRYISLHTADPGEDGTTAEASGSGYTRGQRDASNANWTRTANSVTLAAELTLFTATGAIGPLTHWAIWDASTGGNCLYKGAFATGRSFVNGDPVAIGAGGITITEE